MRLPLAIAGLAVATAVAMVPAPATAAKKKCGVKKEAKGCKLPTNSLFQVGETFSAKYAVLITGTGGSPTSLQGSVPIACSGGAPGSSPGGTGLFPLGAKELALPKRPAVGKTYNRRWQFDEVSPDGRTHSVGDYSFSLTISSAKKAKVSFKSYLLQNAADPEQRVNPDRICEGTSKHTLKRVR